jgi:hypothetical protein
VEVEVEEVEVVKAIKLFINSNLDLDLLMIK